jgi:hypothetical protein
MKEIKIRGADADTWLTVTLLDPDSRPGWVEVQNGAATQWSNLEDVHPADQVALRVERLARQRYKFVPKEDLQQDG